MQDTERCTVCSSTEQKTGEIIQGNENAFGFRGQAVFIISHNHSWLPFNAGLAVFMDRKLLVSKLWKVLVLQVVGVVTTAHWCIVCFMAASSRTQKMYSLNLSPLCSVLFVWQAGKLCFKSLPCQLKRAYLWTQTKWKESSAFVFICSLCGYLSLQATRRTPVGILAHLPMPAGRQETSKCAARCASPAQWDIHCTAQQRESAFPTGPGRADSHFANVSEICETFLWCNVRSSRRQIPKATVALKAWLYS